MKYALVVDLGATNLRIAIVNSKHEIVKKVISNLIFTLRDLELQYPKYIKINEKI